MKNSFLWKKKLLQKKYSGVDKNKLVLHEKVFQVSKKSWCCTKKIISCWQEQDDVAQKNILCSKKVTTMHNFGTHKNIGKYKFMKK